MKKLIAMLGAVVAAVTSAFAATPVAVWEGNFTSTQGGYTITAPEGSTTTIGDTIVIGDAGVKIGTHPTGTKAFTAIIKYRNLSLTAEGSQTIFVGSNSANGNNIGVFMHAENGGLQGIAQNAVYSNKVGSQMPDAGVMVVSHASDVSTTVFLKGASSNAYNDTTLKYGTHNYDSVTIFGGAMADASSNIAGVATGAVIEKIAIFRAKLSQDEVNAYVFPSEKGDYYATVETDAAIDALSWKTFGGEAIDYSAIPAEATLAIEGTGSVSVPADFARTVRLDAGVTIVPASGATTGIFTGTGTVVYNNALPTDEQKSKYQDKTAWQGVVYLKNKAFGACVDVNPYGNAISTIRLTGVTGYNKDGAYTCTVPLELVDEGTTLALSFVNGWSDANKQYIINHLKGAGTIEGKDRGDKLIVRILDWTGFTGTVKATNKTFVFGNKTVAIGSGQIHISSGATVTTSNIGSWTGAVTIDGTVVSTSAISGDKTYNGAGTLVLNATSGHLIQANKITFGGTIKALLNQNNDKQVVLNYNGDIFPSRPEFVLSKTAGTGTLTLSNHCTTHPVTVKDFSGNINIANNYGNGAGDRTIDTLQTKETTYSGVFGANSNGGGTRSLGLTVRGDANNQYKALTLSGTNLSGGTLTIAEYGKVNLTGSWAGNIVVNGILTSPNQIDSSKLSTTKLDATEVVETHDAESGIYTYEPNYVPRTEPTTVYATSQFASYVREDGTPITLIDGDTIVCNDAKMGYNNWSGGKDPAAIGLTGHNYTLILAHEMDFGGNVGIPSDITIKVNYRENNTKGIYLYGNIAEGVTVGTDDDSGLLFLGHTNGNTTIGAGATIECDVGFQGTNKATINGAVTISGDIVTTDGCHIILAEGATLTTAKIAEEGDAITHVTTDVADSHVEYDGTKYVIVANTPEPETPEWLEGESEDTVAAYNTWKAANESSITEATTDEMLLEAFLFGCEPTVEAIAAARAAFVVESIDIDSDGILEIGWNEEGYNGVVEVIGSATIDGTYTVEAFDENTAKFFKLQLVLPSKASPVIEED